MPSVRWTVMLESYKSLLEEETRAEVRTSLLNWYDTNKRDLPFRGTTDPYAIWVSEVMLQQTQVATVKAYWEGWMKAFPDVETLAKADEDSVMQAWAGLGFYRRARALHTAAKLMAEDGIPTTYEGWLDLPGVGQYTAGAIASIAFGALTPAVDGNVQRVLSRLGLDTRVVSKSSVMKEQRSVAASLLDPGRPGDFNQALMELGATVCAPRRPLCSSCPLRLYCVAFPAGVAADLPVQAPKKEKRDETTDIHVIIDSSPRVRMILEEGELLGGLWGFDRETAYPTEYVGSVKHVFSHIRMIYRVHLGSVDSSETVKSETGVQWVPFEKVPEMGISKAMLKVWTLVLDDIGGASVLSHDDV